MFPGGLERPKHGILSLNNYFEVQDMEERGWGEGDWEVNKAEEPFRPNTDCKTYKAH